MPSFDRGWWHVPAPVLFRRLKRLVLGRPKRTDEDLQERLPVPVGLAIFFSDALSSVAYGPEEILLVLTAAGAAGVPYALPVGLAIVALIFVVSTSYVQTIRAYPGGGGAYGVTRENLGELPGLVAAAALLTGYLLTVAVSVAAGVGALTSGFPWLRGHEVAIAVIVVLFMAWMNLRGVRESGTFFAVPTYGFIVSMLLLVGAGVVDLLRGSWHPAVDPASALDFQGLPLAGGGLSVFLLLRAFASGTATLTGLEAVANGVGAFRPPEAENAARTMVLGRTLLAVLFTGVMVLAVGLHVLPREGETVLSQVTRSVFGSGVAYYAVQIVTMLILFLAANTAFAGFPRLLALLARDGYVSRRFANLNDTLVYGLGIGVLAACAALLLVLFRGNTHRLIPLYAVGVFTAFTLSQTGMVVHWLRERRRGTGRHTWSLLVNGLGAVACTGVLVIVLLTKFVQGGWVAVVIIPSLVVYFLSVKHYYERFLDRVAALEAEHMRIDTAGRIKVVLAVGGLSPVIRHAVRVARRLSPDVVAVHVATDPEYGEQIRRGWRPEEYGGIPLEVLESPYRDVVGPLRAYLDRQLAENPGLVINLLVPAIVTNDPFDGYLHNGTASQVLRELLYSEGVLVTVIPFYVDLVENGPNGHAPRGVPAAS
ncbi:MAG: amino acid permease [Bacillota bacterium]|nr:MAG: amino acid permease [Bacillota bacterium]